MGGNPCKSGIGHIRVTPGGLRQAAAQHHQVGRVRREGGCDQGAPHFQGWAILGGFDGIGGWERDKQPPVRSCQMGLIRERQELGPVAGQRSLL